MKPGALVDPALDLVDLDAVQQQLALAAGGVVGPGALGVLGDVHVAQPGLAVVDVHETVDERRASLAQGLDLGALQDESGLEDVLDREVVARLRFCATTLRPCSLAIRPFSQVADRVHGVAVLEDREVQVAAGGPAGGADVPHGVAALDAGAHAER